MQLGVRGRQQPAPAAVPRVRVLNTPGARFDDLVAGTAWEFRPAGHTVVARHPDEVPAVLDEVERLTAAGRWAFGFVTYEAAPGLDGRLRTHDPVPDLPLAWFGVTGAPAVVPAVDSAPGTATGPWTPAWDAGTHRRAVHRVRERIAAGETYQCNLTTRLHGPAVDDPYGLYRDLALGQRGAHHAYLDTGRFVVAGASPELFFATAGDGVRMRPMKGTAPRGRTLAEDDEIVARLRASAKERAENVMIVDLVRNDLGRVAVPGTVGVPRLLHVERFPTVHQLTSDVTARLRPGTGLTELFRALFPCGSVTGAPKARTMELIRDVEPGPRGVYCGATGIVAPPGSAAFRARFAVAIRTVLVDRAAGTATYGAGGGITWDSDPDAEYAELRAKTRVLDDHPGEFHLIETMRHRAGHGLRSPAAHLDRVARSARYFGFRFDDATVRAALAERLDGAGDARVRLRCHRDGSVDVDVQALPAPDDGPVGIVLDPEPLDTSGCWTRHKTSHREPYTRRRARHPSAGDVLLVNERGEITEACTATVAVRLDGVWWTPPLESGCLPGIEREKLVAAGRLHERTLRPGDLARAGDVALVSSLRGWRPARVTDLCWTDGPVR